MRSLMMLALLCTGGCGTPAAPLPTPSPVPQDPPVATQAPQAQQQATPAPPPVVLTADARLECVISSSDNGTQKLVIQNGQGLEFDIVVSPIVDGVVETKGPDNGGSYRFTSHLAKPGSGVLAGVGRVKLDKVETKVNVAMNRYSQQQGAGTELSFTSSDMSMRGIYVEFAGHAVAQNGDRYAFRVTMGAPGEGSSGSVTPASDANKAPIVAKSVVIVAPQTTVVTTTTVQKIP